MLAVMRVNMMVTVNIVTKYAYQTLPTYLHKLLVYSSFHVGYTSTYH